MSAVANIADERLLIEAAQNDPSRFAELYEGNFDRVYAFIARRVRNREEAEDLTSEVFHRALTNLGHFEWRGVPFAAWLLRIAANTLATRWMRLAKSPEVLNEGETTTEPGADPALERQIILSQLVHRLPPDQRLVILRRFVDQRGVREIAAELGRTEGAIKQLQFRALQNLRAGMRKHHE
ncbi:MAG: sigma-70 family RNA polymerase sigma factor [Acidobacteriia bacterium]|nr:sigma-70 family RNA polymerase sigma factor [Terriglobia bacterium]